MTGYNPIAALNAINPSLIGYTGGYGKAMQALGGSMDSIGQTKLDLAKQKEEEIYKNATLKIAQDTQALQKSNADYTKQKDFETKNDKFSSNAATNAMLMGVDAPEMSNEYAKLSLIDPTITAAALKGEKEKYSGTAGGIIYNTNTGAIAGDYRDKSEGSGFGAKGVTHVDTIKGGKIMRTFFMPDGTTKSVMADGTPSGIAGMAYSDALGDDNAYTRPQSSFQAGKNNDASVVIDRGDMPVKIPQGTKFTKAMTDFTYIGPGGMRMVPKEHISAFKKQFPSK